MGFRRCESPGGVFGRAAVRHLDVAVIGHVQAVLARRGRARGLQALYEHVFLDAGGGVPVLNDAVAVHGVLRFVVGAPGDDPLETDIVIYL